jgi:TP901 family phage tail tape measure protein
VSGKDLEALSLQTINLSKLTGESADSIAESTSKVGASWHLTGFQVKGVQDELYAVSTKTGVSVTEMSGALSKMGSVATSAHVPMTSMEAAIGSMAASGIPARQGVSLLTDAITKMQEKGMDAGKEMPLMMERLAHGTGTAADAALLGQKNFDKLNGSLGDSKHGYDAVKDSIEGADGSINKQAKDTETFSDKLSRFKNELMLAFEPLGKVIIKVFSQVLDAAKPIIGILTTIMTAFSNLPGPIQMVIVVIAGIVAAIGPILMIIGMILPAITALTPVIVGIGVLVAGISLPMLLILGAVIAIGIAVYLLYTYFKPFHDAVDQVLGWVKLLLGDLMSGNFGKLGNDLKNGILGALDLFKKFDWGKLGRDMLNAIKSVDWGGLLTTIANALTGIGGSVLGFIKGVDWLGLLKTILVALATIGVEVFKFINSVDWLQLLKTILVALATIGIEVFKFINSVDWGQLLVTIAAALFNIGTQVLGFIVSVDWGSLLNTIIGALGNLGSQFLGLIVNADWGSLGRAVMDALGKIHVSLDTTPPFLHLGFGAEGAYVKARSGGQLMVVGEGGEDEIIAPLSKLGSIGALPHMEAGGILSNGVLSSLSTTKAAAGGGDTTFQVTFQNATITSPQDAERLALQMGYKAIEIMRRQGHTRG